MPKKTDESIPCVDKVVMRYSRWIRDGCAQTEQLKQSLMQEQFAYGGHSRCRLVRLNAKQQDYVEACADVVLPGYRLKVTGDESGSSCEGVDSILDNLRIYIS